MAYEFLPKRFRVAFYVLAESKKYGEPKFVRAEDEMQILLESAKNTMDDAVSIRDVRLVFSGI
jgi:hypothetical protein